MEWMILGVGAVVLALLMAIQWRMIRRQRVKPVVPHDMVAGWIDEPWNVCIDVEMDSMDDVSAKLDCLRR